MLDSSNESLQIEQMAAAIRANSSDLQTFMEVLATKLEGSLPNQTQVVRQSRFLSREHPVKEIKIVLNDHHYRVYKEQQGTLITETVKVVRGIALKTEQIPMEQWIEELATALAQESTHSSAARLALEQFLL
jgi:hypothetical protein